jgi:hypothetical protein
MVERGRKLTLLGRASELSRQSEWFVWADPKFYK